MEIVRQEIFAPVLPVVQVSGPDEAIRCADDTGDGLTSSIYTRDLASALRACGELHFDETYVDRENFEAMQGASSTPATGRSNAGTIATRWPATSSSTPASTRCPAIRWSPRRPMWRYLRRVMIAVLSCAERGPIVWDQHHKTLAALAEGRTQEVAEMVSTHIQGAQAAVLKAIAAQAGGPGPGA
jgi:hypothetical protein